MLPIFGEDVETLAPHIICPPEDEDQPFQIAAFQPEKELLYFEVPDLPSLLNALNYGDMSSRTKVYVLKVIETVVDHFSGKIWSPADEEIPDNYKDIRHEVIELVRLCCVQEGMLLNSAKLVIQKTLHLRQV
jgi:hypothetical protein